MACRDALLILIPLLILYTSAFGSILELEPNTTNDSICYGTVIPNSINMHCDDHFTLAPKSLIVGSKKKNSTCFSIVTDATVSPNTTYIGMCCTPYKSPDCLLDHQDVQYIQLWKDIGLNASGHQNISSFKVRQIPLSNCHNDYMENSTYNYVDYYCIPNSRTVVFNNTIEMNSTGETLYLKSPGYPENTTIMGNHACLVTTNCTGPFAVYGVDYALPYPNWLYFKDLISNKPCSLEKGSNNYHITEICRRESLQIMINFTGRSYGRFRLAFTASGQTDLRIVCNTTVDSLERCDTTTASVSGEMTTITSAHTHSSSKSTSGSATRPYVNTRPTADIHVNHTQSVTNNSQFYKPDTQQDKSDTMTYIGAGIPAFLIIICCAIVIYKCYQIKKKVKPTNQSPRDEEDVVSKKSIPDVEFPTTDWNNPPRSLPPLTQTLHIEKDKRHQNGHQKKKKKKKQTENDDLEGEVNEIQNESEGNVLKMDRAAVEKHEKSNGSNTAELETTAENPKRKRKKKKKDDEGGEINETQTDSIANVLNLDRAAREKDETSGGSKSAELGTRDDDDNIEKRKRKHKRKKKRDDQEGEGTEIQTESIYNALDGTARKNAEKSSGDKIAELETRNDDNVEKPKTNKKKKKKKKNKEIAPGIETQDYDES